MSISLNQSSLTSLSGRFTAPYQSITDIEQRRQSSLLTTIVFALSVLVGATASVMKEEVHTLRTVGFDGCFAKSLDIDTFPDNLKRVLDGEHIWRII